MAPEHPLWWDPDFCPTCSWRAWGHLSSPQKEVFSSNKLLTTCFLHWFFLFWNHDSVITCFLLGSHSSLEPTNLPFLCLISSLENVASHISFISQGSKSRYSLLYSSWRVLNPIMTSTRVDRLPDLQDYIRSLVILRWGFIWQPAINILKCSYPLTITILS